MSRLTEGLRALFVESSRLRELIAAGLEELL
jgi:hypothetical protein